MIIVKCEQGSDEWFAARAGDSAASATRAIQCAKCGNHEWFVYVDMPAAIDGGNHREGKE